MVELSWAMRWMWRSAPIGTIKNLPERAPGIEALMIRDQIKQLVRSAVEAAQVAGALPANAENAGDDGECGLGHE